MKALELKSPFLLIAILLTLLSSPFNRSMDQEWAGVAVGFIWAALIGFGGYRISGSKRWLLAYYTAMAYIFIIVAIEISTTPHYVLIFLKNSGIGFIQICTLYVALRYALSRKGTALDRTIAGICGYFLLAMIWSNFFILIQCTDGHAFESIHQNAALTDDDLLYYSLVNLTTLGYGDIVPINGFARIVATLESAFGTLYLAVMVATLVSELRVSRKPNQ